MNDANPASESTLETFPTAVVGSDTVQWKPTMTTSGTDASALMTDEVSTETTEDAPSLDPERNVWVMASIVLFTNLLVTYFVVKLMTTHQDGMQLLGWARNNEVEIRGKNRATYFPVYVAINDFEEINNGQGGKK